MKKKDRENEYIGIVSIIIIAILAIVALYYFYSHRPALSTNSTPPIEAPAPLNDKAAETQ